jgi:predicted kinase
MTGVPMTPTDADDSPNVGRVYRPAPTLILICGLPGSGKTTLARQLERARPALRLSPDEWIAALLADPGDSAELDRLRDPVEAIQWEVAKRALALGVDVVLEWGFWSRDERANYRAQAEALGAHVEVRFLDVPRDELWARLARRNAERPPGTFVVSEAQLDLWWSWFQPPTDDELVVVDEGRPAHRPSA